MKRTKAEEAEYLALLEAREIFRCADSFEYFLFRYVVTKDEHDPLNPVKRMPDKAYLRFLAREFQHGPDVQYVAKSRQLMVSWLLCALTVWTALYKPHSLTCVQSKKLEDSARLIFESTPSVARCSFILAHLPPRMQVCLCLENEQKVPRPYSIDGKTFSYGAIKLPNGSIVEALAQGAAQVEGKVPTLFLSDESSLMDEWAQSWAAAMPCISNGGRAIAVATMRLPSAYGEEIAPCDEVDADGELRGVARFATASGGSGVRVHYSADPEKDPKTEGGAKWFVAETAKMPGGYDGHAWGMHMEINPLSRSGARVLPMWSRIESKVVIDDLPPEAVRHWKLDAGFDWGIRNRTVWQVFATDYEGTRYMVHELAIPAIEVDGVNGIASLMKSHPLFNEVNGRIHADPSMWNNTQSTRDGVVSNAELFRRCGVRMERAKLNGQEADDLWLSKVLAYWQGHEESDFVPRFYICRSCKETLQGIPNLFYQEFVGVTADKNSLKEKFGLKRVDWQDAWKYAEAASPTVPILRTPSDRPFTFDWLLAKYKKEANKGKYARS